MSAYVIISEVCRLKRLRFSNLNLLIDTFQLSFALKHAIFTHKLT